MKKIIILPLLFLLACDPDGIPDTGEPREKEGIVIENSTSEEEDVSTNDVEIEEVEDPVLTEKPEPMDWPTYVDKDGNCIPKGLSGSRCLYKDDQEIIEHNYRFCEHTCVDGLKCELINGEDAVGICFPEEYVKNGK